MPKRVGWFCLFVLSGDSNEERPIFIDFFRISPQNIWYFNVLQNYAQTPNEYIHAMNLIHAHIVRERVRERNTKYLKLFWLDQRFCSTK